MVPVVIVATHATATPVTFAVDRAMVNAIATARVPDKPTLLVTHRCHQSCEFCFDASNILSTSKSEEICPPTRIYWQNTKQPTFTAIRAHWLWKYELAKEDESGKNRTFVYKPRLLEQARGVIMYFRAAFCLVLIVVAGCSSDKDTSIDRGKSPENALLAAKAALSKHDLDAYFDSLTIKAVKDSLLASIAICVEDYSNESLQASIETSDGCLGILAKHGWKPSQNIPSHDVLYEWKKAIDNVDAPRSLAAELQKYYREVDNISTFVWSYLEPVEVVDIRVSGDIAIGNVLWDGEQVTLTFEKDQTGWRFDPTPREL